MYKVLQDWYSRKLQQNPYEIEGDAKHFIIYIISNIGRISLFKMAQNSPKLANIETFIKSR